MALARPEFVIDFPTLFVAADWVPQHCVIPDGFDRGDAFELVDWQAWCLLNFYRLKPTAKPGQFSTAFAWRRSQIVLPQKAGKAPYTAAHICVEGVGPALFDGWAEGGEVWDCRDHGCGCGWVYEYQPGEAMGTPWPTPLIQITATSDTQTDNIYTALRPMIDEGPLSVLIPKTGEEFIRLPHGGRIDTVTSSARSRLGQRVTYVPQDETGIWTAAAGMIKVAETQRRGLAGMGGRAEETTNAWDPAEESVAQRTAESSVTDIFRHHPEAPMSLSYVKKVERRRIHRHVYRGCPWVDLDAIEAEAAELLELDPAQAERFFGNRSRAGADNAFDMEVWGRRESDLLVPSDSLVVAGIDGARSGDALAAIATDVDTGHQWPIGIWERPAGAPDDYEHDVEAVDGAMLDFFEEHDVWRIYIDPQYIEHLVQRWQGRWGERRAISWFTNRPRPMGWSVRNYKTAVGSIDRGDMTHNGDPLFTKHIRQAKKQKVNVFDDKRRQLYVLAKDRPDSPRKMDAAAAATISWEARGDCIAAGSPRRRGGEAVFF